MQYDAHIRDWLLHLKYLWPGLSPDMRLLIATGDGGGPRVLDPRRGHDKATEEDARMTQG